MYPLLRESQKYFKTRTNSWTFTLYSKLTVGILTISFVLVSTYDYIDSGGSAIQCLADRKIGVSARTLNTFCWFSSTYTLPRHWTGRPDLAWGLGVSSPTDQRVYHAYYQWVPYFLIFLIVLFSIPHLIWENSRHGNLVQNLTSGVKVEKLRIDKLAEYILFRKFQNRTFLNGLLCCEALNTAIVVMVIVLMDNLLGGSFYRYGMEVLLWQARDAEDRVDPISRIFPRMTKCDFFRFGPTGTVINYDALCILGVNVLNEKIFLFLWFWLLLMAIFSSLLLSVRILSAVSSPARKYLQKYYFPVDCPEDLNLRAEEWILLQQLSLLTEKQFLKQLIEEISHRRRNEGKENFIV